MKNAPYIRLVAMGIVLALLLYKPVKRLAMTPLAVHSSWVEPHRKNPFGQRWGELEVGDGKTAREYYGDNAVDAIEPMNEQKRRLFATYRKGQGKMGISHRYGTVEGDPIFTWLLVENGSARFVEDDTHDTWGSRTVATHTLKGIRLGFMRDGKFVEGEPAATDSPIVVLELDYQKGGRDIYH